MQVSPAQKAVTTAHGADAKYNYPIGYLRGCIIALVVAYHSALAYHPYRPPSPVTLLARPHWWQTFPMVDPRKWSAATVFISFNDVFFMSLMFFLSGLFFWQSLSRKGSAKFLRDRLLRLGLPFVVAAVILSPIAHYPTWLQRSEHSAAPGFWQQYFSLHTWPSGPEWFVWVLFTFDCVATLIFALAPACSNALEHLAAHISSRPIVFFVTLVAVSSLAYLPLALFFTPGAQMIFGPFQLQPSRALLYFAYFFLAIGVGAFGLERGVLAPGGKLARRWPLWMIAAVAAFVFCGMVSILAAMPSAHPQAWAILNDFSFVLSCAASNLFFLALFVRFIHSRSSLLDSLAANSYGIYLVHYVFVLWLHYALLTSPLPASMKFVIDFLGALILSWLIVAALRRIPAVARIV